MLHCKSPEIVSRRTTENAERRVPLETLPLRFKSPDTPLNSQNCHAAKKALRILFICSKMISSRILGDLRLSISAGSSEIYHVEKTDRLRFYIEYMDNELL